MSADDVLVGSRRLVPAAPGAKVTWLELFYDLVFVFAFLNVTNTSAKAIGHGGLLSSLLVLALLWFAWSSFVSLGNVVRIDRGIMPVFGFATAAAILVASVSLPEAFVDERPGPPGDLVFAACYLLVRTLEVLAFWYAIHNHPRLRPHWYRLAIPPFVTVALLLIAALVPQRLFTGGAETTLRFALWMLAVVLAFLTGRVSRAEGPAVVSANHWAERHAQIVLVALGESIISLGIGPGLDVGLPITWSVIGAAVAGIAVIGALWWLYFDGRAIAGEQVLHRLQGRERLALARHAYTYLHLPMIAGIILFALGLKRVLTDIGDPTGAALHDRTGGLDAAVLYGGVVLYVLAVLGFQFRTVRRISRLQVGLLVALAALIPVGAGLPSLDALALLAVSVVLATTVDTLHHRQRRRRLRQEKLAEEQALEVRETEWRRRYLEQQTRREPPATGATGAS